MHTTIHPKQPIHSLLYSIYNMKFVYLVLLICVQTLSLPIEYDEFEYPNAEFAKCCRSAGMEETCLNVCSYPPILTLERKY